MIGWLRRRADARIARQADLILTALADGAAHYVVNDLDRAAGLHAGSMYPALARLGVTDRIESGWADRGPGQPRRRWYRTTQPTTNP